MAPKKRGSQTPTKSCSDEAATANCTNPLQPSDGQPLASDPVTVPTAPFVCPLCLRPEVVDPIVMPSHVPPSNNSSDSPGNFCIVCRDCAHDWLFEVSRRRQQAPNGGSCVRCPQCQGEFAAGALDDAFEDSSSMLTLGETEEALVRQNSAKLGKKATPTAISPRNVPSAVESQSNAKQLCGICEAAIGVVECLQCRFNICAECQTSVHSKGQFRRHDVGPVASGLQQHRKQLNKVCPQHTANSLDLFCHTCSSCICVMCCFSGPHREHKVEPLGEVATALENTMSEQRSSVHRCAALAHSVTMKLAEASPQLRQRTASVEACVKETFAKMREAVDVREKQILQELDSFVNKKVAALSSHGDSFRLIERQAERLLSGTELLSAALHPADLVKVQCLIRNRFEEVRTSLEAACPSGVLRSVEGKIQNNEEPDAIGEQITKRLVPTLQDAIFVPTDSIGDPSKIIPLFAAELERYGKLKLPSERPPASMTSIVDNAAMAAADRKSSGRPSAGAHVVAPLPPRQGATSPPHTGTLNDPSADAVGAMLNSVSKRRQFLSLAEEQTVGEPVRKTNAAVRATMPSLSNMFTSLPKRTAPSAKQSIVSGTVPATPAAPTAEGGARGIEMGNLQLRV